MKKFYLVLVTVIVASFMQDAFAQTYQPQHISGYAVGPDFTIQPSSTSGDRACPITAVGISMTNVSSCTGTPCDGSVTVTGVTGGTAPYTYLWSNGQTGATASGLCPGAMNVKVTSAGCTYTYNFTMLKGKQHMPPIRDSLWYNMWYYNQFGDGHGNFWSCDGYCNTIWVGDANNSSLTNPAPNGGLGVINYSTGGGPYHYTWSSNVTGATDSPGPWTVCASTTTSYTVTVMDAACITASVVVAPPIKPNPLVVTSGAVDASCYGVCDGSVTANPTGTGPFTYKWNNGATTATTNALCAGTYSVTVTDSWGCTKAVNGTVQGGVQIIPTINKTDVSCFGGSDGSATASASGGAPGFTYTWNTVPAQNTATASNLSAGTYIVTVHDTKNCTATQSVTITQPTAVALSTSTTTAACGAANGTATGSGSGGTGPYTYSWAPGGQNTATATGLSGGTYTVTVTDSKGCTKTATAVVNSSGPPTAAISGFTNVTCNGANNGTATVTGSGGITPYTYLWNTSPPQTTATATGLSPGNYNVTLTDAFGCNSSVPVTITEPPAIVLTTSSTNQLCGGSNGSASVTASGGTPGYTYLWSPSGGNGANANNLASATYTVTVTDTKGCTQTATATVISTGAATIVINSSTNATCKGSNDGSATSSATAGTSPFTYSWNTSPVQTTPAVTGLSPGTYVVTLTDANGCSSNANVTITEPAPVVVTSSNVTICPNTSATLTANGSGGTGAITFGWNPGALTGSPVTVSPTATTPYTLTGTDANGCTGSTTVTVTVNTAPTINVNPATICAGTSTPLTATGASTYTWAPTTGLSSGTGGTVTASPGTTSTYTITGTDASGCTNTTTVVVTVNPAPVVTSSPATICSGTSTILSANGATTYTWSPSATLSSNAGATVTASPLTTTTYVITGTTNGCTGTANVTVTVNPKPTITVPGGSICSGNSINLTASGASTYAWSPATNLSATTGATVTANPTATTIYTVTGTDANGCTNTANVTVTINPNPVINVPPATICAGSSTTLTATGGITYSWSPTTGLSSGSGATVTANPTTTTTYTVIGTNASGCTNSTTVIVTVNPLPIVTATGGSMCPGKNVTLTAGGAVTYSWSPAGGLSSISGSTVTASPSISTNYVVTGTDANGCKGTANAYVTVHPAPVASFDYTPDPASELDPTVHFLDNSINAVSWLWSLGDTINTTSTLQSPYHTYPNTSGTYIVHLIITDQYGCIDSTYRTIVVRGEFTFYVPNTFTPNGDGKNDGFTPKGTGIDESDYELWIFDRWGNFIWKTNIWGDQWDGRANGGANVAQIDTYVWKVFVREKYSGKRHKYIGHVNIVK